MPGFAIEGSDRVRRRIRYPRTQRHVWAAAIVMAMPRPQNRSQMGLRDRDEPIQTFAADRANQSFAYGVRFRTRNGRSQHVDSQGLDRIVEVLGEDSISIMDQVTVPSSVPHDFPQLLQSPVGARMRRHIEMRKAPRAVLDYHENVQHPKRRSDRNEEVTRKNRLCMVLQEGRPALIAARMTRWPRGHVLPDCPWRNAYAQLHQQFIGDAFLAPQRILARRTSNELP